MSDLRTAISEENVNKLADRAARKADQALETTKRVAGDALDSLQDGVHSLRDDLPSALTRTAHQVEDLARRGIERAKQTSANVRDQVSRGGDATRAYIQDEPMKSVVIAAAAGAALALVVSWLGRRRQDH